jgi:endonuclease/exonuclease/phosphatase family metal-dependent hydrolase
MRRLLALITGMLLLVGIMTAPAQAAGKVGKVALVSFTGASLRSTGATLTVSWAKVKGAKKYEVFVSASYAGVMKAKKPRLRTGRTSATITKLRRGTDYFVVVRGVNGAKKGTRSNRVGHRTIIAEASGQALGAAPVVSALSWNVCSNACERLRESRLGAAGQRIGALAPTIVGLQEASRFNENHVPAGYAMAYNGQNDILYRTDVYEPLERTESWTVQEPCETTPTTPTPTPTTPTTPDPSPTAPTTGDDEDDDEEPTDPPLCDVTETRQIAAKGFSKFPYGRGMAWAVVKAKATGATMLVLSVHTQTGKGKTDTAHRRVDSQALVANLAAVRTQLATEFGAVDLPTIILGDFNTTRQRTSDLSMVELKNAGWHDAFEQARSLTGQHRNTANPNWKLTPVIGQTWGDHVDKVLVQPDRAVVLSWANAGAMDNGKYIGPLPSDHHPLLVTLRVR